MPETFQIGALPRSGTAWISSVLNTCKNVICFHEAVTLGDPKEIVEGKHLFDYSGDCSSAALVSNWRADREIFIYRDPEECRESINRLYPESKDHKESWDNLLGLSVEYGWNKRMFHLSDVTSDVDAFVEMAKFICPKVNICKDKINQMIKMNVQLNSIDQYEEESLSRISNSEGGLKLWQ